MSLDLNNRALHFACCTLDLDQTIFFRSILIWVYNVCWCSFNWIFIAVTISNLIHMHDYFNAAQIPEVYLQNYRADLTVHWFYSLKLVLSRFVSFNLKKMIHVLLLNLQGFRYLKRIAEIELQVHVLMLIWAFIVALWPFPQVAWLCRADIKTKGLDQPWHLSSSFAVWLVWVADRIALQTRSQGFESHWRPNPAHDCMVLHCTLSLSPSLSIFFMPLPFSMGGWGGGGLIVSPLSVQPVWKMVSVHYLLKRLVYWIHILYTGI